MKLNTDQIAITGMGVISPLGNNLKDFWENLINGRCGIRAIRRFDVTGLRTRIGGEVDNFSPTDYMDAKTAKRCARFTQFAIASSDQAIQDAGLEITDRTRHDIGVYIGSGTCSTLEIEQLTIDGVRNGIHTWPLIASFRDCNHSTAFTLACNYQLTGPTMTLTSACNSGANALEVAIDQMRLSKISMAIVVGTEALSSYAFKTICLSRAMSKRNEEPERSSRPFDREHDGFVIAEGAGAIVLEKLGDAVKRNAKPYAVISGSACTNDGYSILKCEPEGKQISRAMRRALSAADTDISQIDYISAHGPSMPETDLAETRAIKRIFGPYAHKLNVSSIKGALGSPLGATNILQVIATSKSISEDVIPPTINLDDPDDECDLDYVPKNARDFTLNHAMINSHAYGGGNSSVILKKI
ncbi:MAG: beta-ketoacyl-[acyl-carrier-protein] synthase family protein [Desulfatitalea sp.]|nr:beta-ketoacyl-[acyl-carrier-protein] synthase family protein [Desulfatitalea sp.]NNK02740.1 beta-ketoacyl-[acyl-carrier-protein] synthase family protein [Desulfatitalea sp.]